MLIEANTLFAYALRVETNNTKHWKCLVINRHSSKRYPFSNHHKLLQDTIHLSKMSSRPERLFSSSKGSDYLFIYFASFCLTRRIDRIHISHAMMSVLPSMVNHNSIDGNCRSNFNSFFFVGQTNQHIHTCPHWRCRVAEMSLVSILVLPFSIWFN